MAKKKKTTYHFGEKVLFPFTEMLEIKKSKSKLIIGIPKEINHQEKRVCLTPDAIVALVNQGHKFVIETGAGLGSNFSDNEYAEAGAKISYNVKEAFECHMVIKVEPPTYEEIEYLKPKSIFFSALQLKTQNKKYFELLAKKRVSAIAFDYIQDEHHAYPLVKSLSEIAGIASIHIAAEFMSKSKDGKGLLLGNIGGVPPSQVVILGAGTVGEFAAKTALALGLDIKVFDNSVTKLRNLKQKLNHPIFTSTIQQKVLTKALMRCDVAIGAIRGETRAPVVVTESMVKKMKTKSIIVDISIDNGGCFETSDLTSHKKETYTKYGVIHYCVPNLPSRYSRTASLSISNIFTSYLTEIAEKGDFENALRLDSALKKGVYFYHGILTNKAVADWFDLPYRDINLLII